MWRDDACVLDMLIAARKVRAFTDGVTLDRFLRDELMQHGIMRLIEISVRQPGTFPTTSRQTTPRFPGTRSSGCGTGWCMSISA